MAIKIIQHKQTPKELAYHFKCGCGYELCVCKRCYSRQPEK